MMSAALAEFSDEPITIVDVEAQGLRSADCLSRLPAPAERRPRDTIADKITLRRRTGSGSGEAQFTGPDAWMLADMLLASWAPDARKSTDRTIEFSISFGDGFAYDGTMSLAGRKRSLATHVKRSDTFRAANCPELSEKEAAHLVKFFLDHYQIG